MARHDVCNQFRAVPGCHHQIQVVGHRHHVRLHHIGEPQNSLGCQRTLYAQDRQTREMDVCNFVEALFKIAGTFSRLSDGGVQFSGDAGHGRDNHDRPLVSGQPTHNVAHLDELGGPAH